MDRHNRDFLSIFTLFLVLICGKPAWSLNAGLSAYETASFTIPDDCKTCEPKFNRFVIHNETGDIYLGASNWLSHLDSDYNELETISTRVDCEDGIDLEDCINRNQLLTIYYESNILITCGSLNDGKCQIRNTSDISNSMEESEMVVPSGDLGTAYVIAPGKISASSTEDVLYVSASFDHVDSSRRAEIPHVCKRRLSSKNVLLSVPNSGSVEWSSAPTDDFITNVVDGYLRDGFTYFLTNQFYDYDIRDTNKYSTILPKIKRVCHDSVNFDSYTDIVIECQGKDGTSYNLIQDAHIGEAASDLAQSLGYDSVHEVLYAVFSKSVQPDSDQPNNQSAICVFNLTAIEGKFLDAIMLCLASENNDNGIQYLDGRSCGTGWSDAIVSQYAPILQCDAQHYALPNGDINAPLVSQAIMEWPDTLLSSITTTTERDHTIAFIGTADAEGKLIKVHIKSATEVRVYETLSLGSPVLKDPTVDKKNQHVTVLTEQKVFKLMVENCGYYTTCEECIGSTADDGDPYCGWCTLTRSCTRWHECDKPDNSTRWLSYNEAQCSGVSQVLPFDSQPITIQQNITVTVEQLPDLGEEEAYECVFDLDDISEVSKAVQTNNNLKCQTPDTTQLPKIPSGADHVTMLLSIRSTESDVKFVDTNYTFYECGTHKRCLDCASSSWDCDWCVYGDVCTHDKNQCPNDEDSTLIASEKHHRPNPNRQGPSECAQLENHPEEVLLATGVERVINITVKNLPDINQVPADRYECILYFEDKELKTSAQRIEDETIQCMNTKYSYQANIQELTANLTLHWTWGETQRRIDDEFGFKVTLFKCEVLRPDCSRCVSAMTTRPELRCGWCSASDICAVEDHSECGSPDSWIREIPDAGTEQKNCPRPVFSIWPSSGPFEGNTLIEINGTNLGTDFNKIKSVTVAGQECNYIEYEDMYEIGERLFCMTNMGEADSTNGMDVFVEVEGIDGTNQMNDAGTKFAYRNPDIREFSPKFGPEAGGTMVNITGSYLLTGRNISIHIGNATCDFDRSSTNQEELLCSTSDSYEGNIAPITMTFDGAKRISNESYRYRGNPDISNVRPSKAFEAGGRMLTVTGTDLDVVQNPRIVISLGGNDYTQECEVGNENGTVMSCPSPNVEVASRRRRQDDDSDSARVGFIMDGVTDLLTWSTNDNRSFVLTYYENPNYFNFMKNLSTGSAELQIEGERLNLASDESDVTVYVGGLLCEIVSLGGEVLTCLIPKELRNNTVENLNVTIIQGNLYFEDIGIIIFLQEPIVDSNGGIPFEVIIGVAAVAFVLLVLIIILTVVFRAREKRAIKQTKKLLHEMEKLEESMAGTIREAFAQLQLDLRDLTNDLEGTGMPFVTPAQYATNMLFAGINIKPSTADPVDIDDRKVRAMEEFSKLLQDKNFLLTFIRVLDEPRSAPVPVIRERNKFACFLTTLMLLEDKLPYLTDVMLTLLEGDIDDAVEDDKALQLCQRTETVVERLLTNWVSVCLFQHLKDQAAFPLFVLYRAILLQTEKGPVDIVTGKAYYSLSEHYVLTLDNIEYKSMILKVVVNAGDGESKEIDVNNLDTISQVKEKILDLIYRNKAYSERPDTSVVDLEWRQGKAGRLILRDDDQTTMKDDEFRRINTLDHYKVPDGANVALVVKQNVPNGAIDPNILRTSIFVQGEEDGDEGADAQTLLARRPQVSLYQKRARARYTVYELENVPMDDPDRNLKVYHLEREEEEQDYRKSWAAAKNRLSRRVSEAIKQHKTNVRKIHYPQLLTTKGATYQFVDQMFDAVLDTDHIPRTVKYMFDFLDVEARRRNITESEIVHKWKSNCLPLRFWVTIINNPQYIFDIRESRSVSSSLSVVGQAFFDAFNRTEHKNNMETAFNKLLYHRELGGFQERVDNYYETINDLPQVDNREMEEELNMISQQFTGVFSRMSTLTHLYNFAQINNDKLIEALEEDEFCRKSNLAYKLENITGILEGETV